MRLVFVAIGWSFGLFISASMPSIPVPFWWGLAAIALVGVVLVRRSYAQRWFFVCLIAFAIGGLRYESVNLTSDVAAYNGTGGLTIEGVVVAEPDVRDDRISLRVQARSVFRVGETTPTSGIVLVEVPRIAQVAYGDYVAVTGQLITPPEFDTFSYAGYLARSGVFSIMPDAFIEVLSSGHGLPLYDGLFRLKAQAQRIINNALPEPSAGLLSGILLGNERGLSPQLQDDFSKVGASHIIAISGFNMVIISGLIMQLLSPLANRRYGRVVAAVFGVSILIVYTIFVGANAAVVRAAVMSSMLVIAPMFKRRTFVPASLAAVLVAMSFLSPTVLWDISFQLSFLATLSLALYADSFSRGFDSLMTRLFPLKTARTLAKVLNEPLVVTLAAQVLTLPLIILYFNRLSIVSIAVNLLIIGVQSWLLIIGGLALLVSFIVPGVGQILFWADLLLLSWSIAVVRLFADLPFADVEFVVDSRIILLYFVMMIGGAIMNAIRPAWSVRFAGFVRQRAIFTATVFSGVAFALLTIAALLSRPDGQLHVWLLDMGHSNAVLMQTPGGAQVLVDGGQFPSRLLTALGDRMPFHDREIEVLVLTHPDEFDTGAITAVTSRYDIGIALTNGQPNQTENFLQIMDSLADTEVITVQAGYTVDFDDGVRIEILHPQMQPEIVDPLNDHVIVMRVTYGDVSFLLTSDLSAAGQVAILEGGQWPVTSVMQLPQHGTISSLNSDFLAAAQPQVVLLQSDRANRRGDPDGDTLNLVAETPLFRTDESGIIHLWTDGATVWSVGEG